METDDECEGCPWIPAWAQASIRSFNGWNDISLYYNALLVDTQESKKHILKPLYTLLLCLSSAISSNKFHCADAWSISIQASGLKIDAKVDDIQMLQNLIFKRFFEEVHRCLTLLHGSDSFPVTANHGDFCLFLRCCIRILLSLEFDCRLSQMATTRLVALFWNVCSANLIQAVLDVKQAQFFELKQKKENTNTGINVTKPGILEDVTKEGSGRLTFELIQKFAGLLEVFVDELILFPDLVESFTAEGTDCSEILKSTTSSAWGKNVECALEALFVHCLLFEGQISDFFIHLDACMSLQNAVLSLPACVILVDTISAVKFEKIFKAHVLLLVSGTISTGSQLSLGELPLDLASGQLLSLLESSVKLYCTYHSLTDEHKNEGDCNGTLESPVLESCLTKYGSLQANADSYTYSVISMMWNREYFCHPSGSYRTLSKQSHADYIESPLDALKNSLCIFIQENNHFPSDDFDQETKDILVHFVKYAYLEASERDMSCNASQVTQSSVFLLASILHLLGSTLERLLVLQREKAHISDSHASDHHLQSECYHYIVDLLMTCTQKCSSQERGGVICNDVIAEMLGSSQQSVGPVLCYFVNDLCAKFKVGSELLCKGHIGVIKSLLRLFLSEQGASDVLKALSNQHQLRSPASNEHSSRKDSLLICNPLPLEVDAPSNSLCIKVTPRVKTIVLSYLEKRKLMSPKGREAQNLCIVPQNRREERNPYFLALLRSQNRRHNDFHGLDDFVVCEEGKDYTAFLRERCKIRARRYFKESLQRKKRQREFLQLLSGIKQKVKK